MEVVSAATTFTFLFTDIEASTRRWEADPEAMEKTLGRHDAILRAAVAEHRGRIFKHTGDGMCSVFPTPAAAVGAAVTAQLRLGEEDWGAPGPLRVRWRSTAEWRSAAMATTSGRRSTAPPG